MMRWRLKELLSHSFDTLGALPLVIVLHRFGWAGHAPLALVVASLLCSVALQQPGVQRRLAGGDLQQRLALRMGLQIGVVATVNLYILGWGPLLVVGHAVPALQNIRWSGSRAWRPAVGCILVGVLAGQLAVASGWVFCYLDQGTAQIAGAAGAILAVMVVRQYGLATAQAEASEAAVKRGEQRFRSLVQYSSDMTVILDRLGAILYVSPAIEKMLGVGPDPAVGRVLGDFMLPDDRALHEQMIAAIERTPRLIEYEVRLSHRDGSTRWHNITLQNLLHDDAVMGLVSNHRDITEEKHAWDSLRYEASHDLLTGLDNRTAFLVHTEDALRAARGEGQVCAVLFVDLDGFKKVNDSLGHDAGDRVLTRAATVLRECVLGGDVVGRLGGDEFAITLARVGSAANAERVVSRILEELAHPHHQPSSALQIGASIGLALSSPTGCEPSAGELLRRADVAMYTAKRGGGRSWQIYHPQLEPTTA